jgi:hypothetical protein
MLYETIMKGNYNKDFVDAIREWVIGNISRSSQVIPPSRKSPDPVSSA